MFELLLLAFFLPDTQLNIAVKLSLNNQHEQSESILKNVRARDTNQETYMFYRFLNNFRMNNKKEAEKYADYLQGIELNLPERYQVLTYLMKEDMQQWKDDDLNDISRDMAHVKDRLVNDLGKKTQKIQQDIVAKLDKMIKENEDKMKDQQDKAQGSSGSPKNTPTQPAQDSHIAGDGGTGTVDRAKFKNITERWNSLPPRERTAALQELTQGMSPRHREAVENYFRRLAESQSKK